MSVTQTLGVGFNSIAVETDSGLVFRVARTPGTAAGFAKEQRLLPRLSGVLPVAVPDPQWFAAETEHFPYGVIGYPKIEGRTLHPSLLKTNRQIGLAGQIANLLEALHGLPLGDVARLDLPGPVHFPIKYRTVAKETLPVLRQRMTSKEVDCIDRWWDAFLADERMTLFEPALTHGDFWFENMIVDQAASRLTGVVDWEHAAIGDRAQGLRDAAPPRRGLHDRCDRVLSKRWRPLRRRYAVPHAASMGATRVLRRALRRPVR